MTLVADRLFVNARELVTLADGPATGARRGAAMQALGSIHGAAIAVRDGLVLATGPTEQLLARVRSEEIVDLQGLVVFPGFVDAHTHPVFAATRENEFHQRCAGADYLAIAAAGGGILSSVRAVRAATENELVEGIVRRFDAFLAHGTTTIEAKSGYGLSTDDELKSLRALTRAAAGHPLGVSRTFLGAHEVPEEYRPDTDAYVTLLVEEMLPAVVGLCEACDVFAEPKVFDAVRSRRILEAARAHGLRLRVHADEIQPMGGTELAVELDADSADHLAVIGDAGIAALAASRTVGVLLPGTSFYLGKGRHAPARRLLEAGAAVALATDFNPGTCYTQSMPLIATLACVILKMTPAECITAMTINPAASLGLDVELGTLHEGKRADFVALDLPSAAGLGYVFGGNPNRLTVKDGRVVWRAVSGAGSAS
ncbi:MAG: imidazolonepropionase [Planctomycetes bacterium]|nr:imidazolonepropionase [Planctomycetota bacterium]